MKNERAREKDEREKERERSWKKTVNRMRDLNEGKYRWRYFDKKVRTIK